MRISPDLTEREKAAIYYAVYAGIKDFKVLWQISRDKATADADPRNNGSNVSNWRHSAKVKNYFEQVERERARIIQEERAAAVKEYELKAIQANGNEGEETESPNGNKTRSGVINFQDKTQFLQYLNKQANLIQDPKLKADYLKMLSDLMRFKETETGKDNEIQRFYTPLNCSKCPLYAEKSEIETE